IALPGSGLANAVGPVRDKEFEAELDAADRALRRGDQRLRARLTRRVDGAEDRVAVALRRHGEISAVDAIVERDLRRGQILKRTAERFEQRDLIMEAAAGAVAARQLEEIAGDIEGRDYAGGERLRDVAGLLLGGLTEIDEDAGAGHGVVIGFAHLRRTRTDE